jgi:hypothetical protein
MRVATPGVFQVEVADEKNARAYEPVVNTRARTRGSPGKSDGASGRQLHDMTMAFHFDSARVAWIHADDRALSADAKVQM